MRVAAIYDIHGNLPALEAVLEDIYNEAVDCIVVGGDVVAGPLPSETLALLQSVTSPTYFIHGNAEAELLRYLAGEAPGGLSERADDEARWVAQVLSPEEKQFVASWSATVTLDIDGWGDVLFCHATPNSNITVFTAMTPEEKLLPLFSELTASLVVCGHTHMPFDRTIGGVRVINAGSVGMPFGRTGADWLFIDTDLDFRHLDYNATAAAERIRQSAYPQAEDFAAHNVLQAPSKEDAMKMLAWVESKQAK
ncbi:MAG: metallophosphoesterase family protein [Anaerolineae bacterium]|nr:metallophosphoesterase family protein [Anaerolineae bacterium]